MAPKQQRLLFRCGQDHRPSSEKLCETTLRQKGSLAVALSGSEVEGESHAGCASVETSGQFWNPAFGQALLCVLGA